MTFKVRGHRVIVDREKGRRVYGTKKAETVAQEVVSRQNEETNDCYGNWGGFGVGSVIVAVQV